MSDRVPRLASARVTGFLWLADNQTPIRRPDVRLGVYAAGLLRSTTSSKLVDSQGRRAEGSRALLPRKPLRLCLRPCQRLESAIWREPASGHVLCEGLPRASVSAFAIRDCRRCLRFLASGQASASARAEWALLAKMVSVIESSRRFAEFCDLA